MTSPRPKATLKKNARTRALTRLSVREYGVHEMLTYLQSKGISPETAAATVSELVKEKILSDYRYACAVTRAQALRDKGPTFILALLRQNGVRIELGEVKSLFAEHSDRSEFDLARSWVERHYPHAREDDKALKRAQSALLRRGFSPDVIRKALWGRPDQDFETDQN